MNKLLYLYRHNNQVLNDAFDRIVVGIHLEKQRNGYKSFLLCGCEPGVGTTSIAINLAISMAMSGIRTILVDCDMRKLTKYKRLNDETVVGLSDYLTLSASLDQVTYYTNYDFLHYIPSGVINKTSISLLCSTKMKEIVSILGDKYECIIYDFPSTNSAVDAKIIAADIDAVIMIAAHGTTSKKKIKDAKRELSAAGANIMGIIVNKVDHNEYKRSMDEYDYFNNKKYLNADVISQNANRTVGKFNTGQNNNANQYSNNVNQYGNSHSENSVSPYSNSYPENNTNPYGNGYSRNNVNPYGNCYSENNANPYDDSYPEDYDFGNGYKGNNTNRQSDTFSNNELNIEFKKWEKKN